MERSEYLAGLLGEANIKYQARPHQSAVPSLTGWGLGMWPVVKLLLRVVDSPRFVASMPAGCPRVDLEHVLRQGSRFVAPCTQIAVRSFVQH